MAVTQEESQQNINNLVNQGISQDYITQQMGALGYQGKLNSGEARNILKQFQSQSPYSGQNVVSAVTNPSSPYDYNDPYGVRTTIENNLGYGAVNDAVNKAYGNLQNYQTETQGITNAIRGNRDLATGLSTGFENQQTRDRSQQAQVLANIYNLELQKKAAIENKINQQYEIYNQEKQYRQQAMLEGLQYGANVNMGMSLTDIAKETARAKKVYEQTKEDEAYKKEQQREEDNYKKTLKQTAISLGIKTSGKSKDIEKRLRKYYEGEQMTKKQKEAIELALAKKSLNKSSVGSSGSGKELDYYDPKTQERMIEKALGEGFNWNDIKETFKSLNIPVDEGSYMDNYLKKRFYGDN